MKELDEIDRLFQTTFEGFELTPDPSVKAFIDNAIASKKKRRKFFFILFPIFFSIAILASALYFYPFPGKTTPLRHAASQKLPAGTTTDQNTFPGKTAEKNDVKSTHDRTHTQELNSAKSTATQKFAFRSKKRTAKTKNSSYSKNNSRFRNQAFLGDTETLPSDEVETQTHSLTQAITQTEVQIQAKEEIEAVEKNEADNLTALSPDSISKNVAETVQNPEGGTPLKKWSLSIVSGWESEKKRPLESFDSTFLSFNPRESARIHSSSFYGKIEANRKITNRLDGMIGLGFRSSSVKQYGSLYSLDSFHVYEGASSVPNNDSIVYFINRQNETRTYQVNSILVPIGLSFAIPISRKFDFRISGGAEFAYGWITNNKKPTNLSSPKFRPFGCSVWLRPEVHYSIGKTTLFGFGSFNQSLYQQLKWDFEPRRNPAFGAGIGVHFLL